MRDHLKVIGILGFWVLAAVTGAACFVTWPFATMLVVLGIVFVFFLSVLYAQILDDVRRKRARNPYVSKRRYKSKFNYDNWTPYHWDDK